MERFAINLENVKNKVLFDCILMGSKVAKKYKYKKFYTNAEKEPDDWYDQFLEDISLAVKNTYKGESFHIFIWFLLLQQYCKDLIFIFDFLLQLIDSFPNFLKSGSSFI